MIDMQIDARSMGLLEQAMKSADKKTNKTFGKNADSAMHFIGRSAGAEMKPKGRTKREIIENPERTGKGKKARGSKYLIVVKHQDKADTFLNANKKSDKRRKIAKLGLAATVMRMAASKFGKPVKGKRVKGATKFFRTTRTHGIRKHHVKIHVELSYILAAFPGVINIAMKKGLTSFIHGFDRDWATALKGQKWA